MLMDRIMGALTFRQAVYDEVENDPTFTTNAWIIVAAVSFLGQLGLSAVYAQSEQGVVGWLIATVVNTIFALLGFALSCAVVGFVAKSMFGATVTFEELVRTQGLARIWGLVGLLGIVGAISPALVCIVSPITLIAALAGLAASAIALKAALDLDWPKTIIVAVIAFIVLLIVSFIASAILGVLGFAAGAAAGAFDTAP